MVEQTFIDKLQEAMSALVQSRGDISLFAAFKMDDLTDKWAVIVAAPWVQHTTFESVFNELRGILIDKLGEEMSTVARIGVFDQNNHFTQLILDKYKTDDTITEDQQVNGNLVHSGIIVYADKNTAEQSGTSGGL
jgi:hypothetical protein